MDYASESTFERVIYVEKSPEIILQEPQEQFSYRAISAGLVKMGCIADLLQQLRHF